MTIPEDDKQRALRREWAAARIVVLGGLVLAIAVAGYFVWRERIEAQNRTAIAHAVTPQKIDRKLLARVELALCSAELVQAQAIGIIPSYGRLASPNVVRANVTHRYICEAATHLTRYFIAADLLCENLRDSRCVSVYRIVTKNGQLIYSRPE